MLSKSPNLEIRCGHIKTFLTIIPLIISVGLSFKYISGVILWITVTGNIGTMMGFSAILLPQLEDEDILPARSEEASWIGKSL